ncbi:Unc-50 [Balamuthia mandrillaris]
MLPQHAPSAAARFRSSSYVPEYLRRLVQYPQMDIEYTFWQMFYLCVDPGRVYRTTSWRKQTKNQWARDDPAFVGILILFQAVAALSFAVAFRAPSLTVILKIMFWTTIVEFLGLGVLIATINWFISNRYLRAPHGVHSVEQKVEWLYAYDIHCNSFFPLFVLLYVVQFFCMPVFLLPGFIPAFLSNTLFAFAFAIYFRLTFMGYNVLPFLQNTVYFLWPILLVVLGYVLAIVSGFNASIFVANYYFGGVHTSF